MSNTNSPTSARGFWAMLGMLALMGGMLCGAVVWTYVEWRDAQDWRSQAQQMSAVAAAALSDHKALSDLKLESQRERVAMQKSLEDLRAELKQLATAQPVQQPVPMPLNNWDAIPQPPPRMERMTRRGPRAQPFMPAHPARRSWGPEQALGEPDTLQAGDATTAWASRTADAQPEWLQLEFAQPVTIARVRVHESYNPGALSRVTIVDDKGQETEAWKGQDPTPAGAGMGVSVVPFEKPLTGNRVKLYLDSQAVAGWNEIDAVGIEDEAGKIQYAVKATASSTYAEINDPPPAAALPALALQPVADVRQGRAWGTEQATGAPDVLAAGDDQHAWASRTQDEQPEWLILEYATPVKITRVHVHESYNPGALTRVTLFDDKDNEVEAWQGKDPTPITAGSGTSTVSVANPQLSRRIKIYLDSQNVPGWNEIDAVGIEDEAGKKQFAVRCTASSCYAEPGQPHPQPERAIAPLREQF